MNKNIFSKLSVSLLVAVVLASSFAAGCGRKSSRVYTRDQAQTPQSVSFGTVMGVEPVTIESGRPPVAGAMGGAAMGGGAGYALGRHHRDGALAVAGGALVGAAAGAMAEKAMTTNRAYEITVQMENGEYISVVQDADVSFTPGERVRVLYAYDGTTRVSR